LDPLNELVAEAYAEIEPPRRGSPLSDAIEQAVAALKAEQSAEGYWCYEFEADCTIAAEYVLMMHFMDEVDTDLEAGIGVYLRDKQCDDGGWALYPGGASDLSCTVKVYFALKMLGDAADSGHLCRAREFVLAAGGAAHANVFTRITLALFGQVPWRAVPFIPVEIVLLPAWFPFHINKVSYWSRTVMVPLFILCTLKPRAENPRGVDIGELFTVHPEQERNYFPIQSGLNRLFFTLDRLGRLVEPLVPAFVRRKALVRARDWFVERLNGVEGLGGIFPAMVNAHEALKVLGYPANHPLREQTREALRRLLVMKADRAYCQPCRSPVWDTGLACLALQEAQGRGDPPEVLDALDWLKERQLLDEPGDWQLNCDARGGGWAFEFANSHYPDVDDTPVIAWAMLDSGSTRYAQAVARAAEWIIGTRSTSTTPTST
jgi:squalene-hopene/tetraprenyl-beta-curcumene cyclase